jgi:hypothetical protein
MDPTPAPLIPQDGWHCLHLYYRIEYGQWQLLNAAEQRAAEETTAAEQVFTARWQPVWDALSEPDFDDDSRIKRDDAIDIRRHAAIIKEPFDEVRT